MCTFFLDTLFSHTWNDTILIALLHAGLIYNLVCLLYINVFGEHSLFIQIVDKHIV